MIRRFPWIALAGLWAAGCGGTGDVKGTVYFKGEKLKFGTVSVTASNGVFQCLITEEGAYEFQGVGTGKAKFHVVCQDPKTVELVTQLAMQSKDPNAAKDKGGRVNVKGIQGAGAKALEDPNLIPAKYGDLGNEILVYTITSGPNTYDIRLDP
jgi:hypothetical protein